MSKAQRRLPPDDPGATIGYKNPPLETRWQKGQPSPNKRGRPRKPRTEEEFIEFEANRKVPVKVGGKIEWMPTRQARQLSQNQQAMMGNTAAFKAVAKEEERVRKNQEECKKKAPLIIRSIKHTIVYPDGREEPYPSYRKDDPPNENSKDDPPKKK